MKVLIDGETSQGNYHEKNQDRIICHQTKMKGLQMSIACICDGIGSFENSEIAAEMMTMGISQWFMGIQKYCPKTISKDEILEDLELTIREINELVCQYRLGHNEDIGCTMSLLLILNRNYYVFHVGDSRVYCLRDQLCQLTHDEVVVKVVHGRVRSALVNYIGKEKKLWMNKVSGTVEENDLFVVGSDGFYKNLRKEDLRRLKEAKSQRLVRSECRRLLNVMMERGETDNLSIAVLLLSKKKFFHFTG